MFVRTSSLIVCAAATSFAIFAAPARAEGTIIAGKFSDWTLHINEGAGYKICFATSEPKEKLPAAANRATALFYVSAWPKDGIKSEVSVKLGYPIKSGSEVVVTVDKDVFKLFAKDERAYVADTTQELKLVESMKKAAKVKVEATSERGTATTDTYSLNGISQALQALATNCP